MIRQRIGNLLETVLDANRLRRAPGLPSQIHMSVIDRCFCLANTVTFGKIPMQSCQRCFGWRPLIGWDGGVLQRA